MAAIDNLLKEFFSHSDSSIPRKTKIQPPGSTPCWKNTDFLFPNMPVSLTEKFIYHTFTWLKNIMITVSFLSQYTNCNCLNINFQVSTKELQYSSGYKTLCESRAGGRAGGRSGGRAGGRSRNKNVTTRIFFSFSLVIFEKKLKTWVLSSPLI